MANWGLLGGLGAGLSQFGATLNQGLNADIAAKRQEEIEARREASIEKRWAKQEARANRQEQAQSERWAKQDERQAERDTVSDSQFDRTATNRENSVIESNISGIMQSREKALAELTERYQKQAVDSMGYPMQGEALASLKEEFAKESKHITERYREILDTRVKSYGERLRGTGFSYLLDVPDIKEPTKKKDPPPSIPGQVSIDDLFNKALGGQSKATPITGMVRDLETGEMVEAAGTPSDKSTLDKLIGGGSSNLADPSFASGFARGLGGFYKNDVRPVDYKNMSPLEFSAVSTGETLGYGFGLMGDAGQYVNDKAVQPAWSYLTQKPSQR